MIQHPQAACELFPPSGGGPLPHAPRGEERKSSRLKSLLSLLSTTCQTYHQGRHEAIPHVASHCKSLVANAFLPPPHASLRNRPVPAKGAFPLKGCEWLAGAFQKQPCAQTDCLFQLLRRGSRIFRHSRHKTADISSCEFLR